jgi:predicted RND superfamily exporter protein
LEFGLYAFNLAQAHASSFFEDDIEILVLSKKVSEYIILQQVYHDMYICMAAGAFIWLYVTIHLRSLFLSTVSMLNIAISIPMGLIIYKLIIGIPFFCLLHILVVLIVLGIGADNTFLFNDTWTNAREIPALKNDLHSRVALSLRKASSAIIATSITNFVAFLGTCFSPLMPMSGFGIFALAVVSIDYILIILILPAYYIFYEKHVEGLFSWRSLTRRIFCCRKQLDKKPDVREGDIEEGKKN